MLVRRDRIVWGALAIAGLIGAAVAFYAEHFARPATPEDATVEQGLNDLSARLPWYTPTVSRVLIRPIAHNPTFLAQLSGTVPIRGSTPWALLARWRVAWFRYADRQQLRVWSRQDRGGGKLTSMKTNAWAAIPALLKLTRRPDPGDRIRALAVLSQIEAQRSPDFPGLIRKYGSSPRSIESFVWLVDRRNEFWLSTSGLWMTGSPFNAGYKKLGLLCLSLSGPAAKPAVPRLLALAESEEDHELGAAAVEALGHIGPGAQAALPLLRKLVVDREKWPDLRSASALAWARINPKDPGLIPLLRELLSDDRALVRVRAAGALGELHQEPGELLPVLTNALTHKLVSVRLAALESLAGLGKAAAPVRASMKERLTDEKESVREAARDVLHKVGS
jgi:hypothetical protein